MKKSNGVNLQLKWCFKWQFFLWHNYNNLTSWKDKPILEILSEKLTSKGEKEASSSTRVKVSKKKVRLWNSVSHSHLLQKLQKCVKIGPHTITHFEQGLKIWKNFSRSGIRTLTYLIKAIYVISIKDDDPHASSLFLSKNQWKKWEESFLLRLLRLPINWRITMNAKRPRLRRGGRNATDLLGKLHWEACCTSNLFPNEMRFFNDH